MMKLAVSVVDLDASSKGFAELHLGTGEAEAFWLGGIWKRRPSHCTTLSLLTMRSWTKQQMRLRSLGRAPSLFRFSGSAAEAAVVVG